MQLILLPLVPAVLCLLTEKYISWSPDNFVMGS